MLTPRLTDCPQCADIPNLLKKIDCKLAEYANGLYNNVVFMLNQVVPAGAMIQLLAYKRILTYKQCNPDYLSDFCIDKIISKVIRLTLGCDIKPIFTPIPTTSTTSTSTTCPPLNCSFDGTGVSSCSFTGTVHKVTITPTTTSTTSATPTTSTTSTTSSTTSTTSSTSSTSTTSSSTSTTSTSTSSTTTTTTTISTACSTCAVGDVVIGTQTWTGCNLDITNYRNGDIIPQVTDTTEWAALTTGAWCYYENDPLNCITYGKLYNWFAVNDPRGLAPIGYHVPTDTEYTTLITYLSGTSVAGGKMKEVGTTHWYTPNTGATNESNLTILPGGWRTNFGGFNNIQNNGVLWSSTEVPTTGGKVCFLAANNSAANIYSYDQVFGFSIRLIKD